MNAGEQQELIFKGVGAVPGQALGPVMLYVRPHSAVSTRKIAADEIPGEIERVAQALAAAGAGLEKLAEEVREKVGAEEAAIFEAQALMSTDPTIVERAQELVASDLQTADSA